VPTTSKENVRPSVKVAEPASALATTCAEVRRYPSPVITTAEPPPASSRPR
jgi:hypothetical protein